MQAFGEKKIYILYIKHAQKDLLSWVHLTLWLFADLLNNLRITYE